MRSTLENWKGTVIAGPPETIGPPAPPLPQTCPLTPKITRKKADPNAPLISVRITITTTATSDNRSEYSTVPWADFFPGLDMTRHSNCKNPVSTGIPALTNYHLLAQQPYPLQSH